MTRNATLPALLLLLVLTPGAAAHEGLHEQIMRITERLAREPNAELFLQRGELHRLHGNWKSAERDYLRARKLHPGLTTVDLCRGLLSLDRGRGEEALKPLRRFVTSNAEDARGHLALARALSLTGKAAEAANAFAAAFEHIVDPDPDLLLQYVHAVAAARGPADALQQLDAWQTRIGPVVTLQLAAIDLEVASGRYDEALRRIDAAMGGAVRKETWLERKRDILLRAGREADALLVYRAALEALSLLPPERRFTRGMQQLEERLRRAIN